MGSAWTVVSLPIPVQKGANASAAPIRPVKLASAAWLALAIVILFLAQAVVKEILAWARLLDFAAPMERRVNTAMQTVLTIAGDSVANAVPARLVQRDSIAILVVVSNALSPQTAI